jgi:hypothetical protein
MATNALVRTEVQSGSHPGRKSWVWTSPRCQDVSAFVEKADPIDPNLIELVVHLCMRIGMIMEDVTPLAINASRNGLEDRVAEVVNAIRMMAPLADSLEALLLRNRER